MLITNRGLSISCGRTVSVGEIVVDELGIGNWDEVLVGADSGV